MLDYLKEAMEINESVGPLADEVSVFDPEERLGRPIEGGESPILAEDNIAPSRHASLDGHRPSISGFGALTWPQP